MADGSGDRLWTLGETVRNCSDQLQSTTHLFRYIRCEYPGKIIQGQGVTDNAGFRHKMEELVHTFHT